ncbi:MAG: amidohydrolase [Planctomycetia bacterium]|nr:amidohydrolase [Planctomycetia bacterium]
MNPTTPRLWTVPLLAAAVAYPAFAHSASAVPLVVRGDVVHTMAGPPLADGVVVVEEGKIRAIGPAATTPVPDGAKLLRGAVVTPGLVDAHSVVGLSGYLNQPQDQDQLDPVDAVQPELRAIDAYNPQERLVEWLRGFGVTTIHTGHAPGALVAGQTMVAKLSGDTVEAAVMRPAAMVAVTLGDAARTQGPDADKKSPGTRSKAVAMLRGEFVRTREYLRKRGHTDESKRPDTDLRLEALARVLAREWPLLVTADRSHDIASALRLAEEFGIRVVLDSAAEAYLLADRIRAAGVPVIVHPTMRRAGGGGDTENLSFETAATLRKAGIPIALQSGYESYVPKTRVVLFEAGVAAAHGLTFEQALAAITIDAARIVGVADRVGSLEIGKDGDLAIYDGDPFEYTTHCTGVVIDGVIMSTEPR